MKNLLLRTIHGSRLYGLDHPGSDEDWFEVYGWDKFRGKQKISGDQDVVKVSLDQFLRGCQKGVPQYLEALWSPVKEVNEIAYITDNYRPGMTIVRNTYLRTIKSFAANGLENNDVKRLRHAWRLKFNLEEMEMLGNFNPRMESWTVDVLTTLAERRSVPDSERYW